MCVRNIENYMYMVSRIYFITAFDFKRNKIGHELIILTCITLDISENERDGVLSIIRHCWAS